MKYLYALAVVLLLSTQALTAQTDIPVKQGGRIYQLGLPPIYKGNAGASFGWLQRTGEDNSVESSLHVMFHAGIRRDLMNPVAGLLAINAEGYIGYSGDGQGISGVRGLLSVPILHIGLGADYNFNTKKTAGIARIEMPLFRGGLFGAGSQLRFDFIGSEEEMFLLGLDIPLWGKNNGKTRPKRTFVKLYEPDISRIELPVLDQKTKIDQLMAKAEKLAKEIALMVTPIDIYGGNNAEKHYHKELAKVKEVLSSDSSNASLRLEDKVAEYHQLIAESYASILGKEKDSAAEVAATARQILLDEIVLPYDAMLGMVKKKDALTQYEAAANAAFADWTLRSGKIDNSQYEQLAYVFQSQVHIIDAVHSYQKDRWDDSRMIWLPLQLALSNDETDTYDKVEKIIERATKKQFTEGNYNWYALNEEFKLALDYSIQDAKKYHVLWIHDFRGNNGQGKPDEIAFRQMLLYINTIADRVSEYDETGLIPNYYIFLDQNYFEVNKGRRFLRALKEPLDYKLDLPKGYEQWEADYQKAQNRLNRAIAESKLLQAELRQYGQDWLEDRIQVHINITNPSDHSFVNRGVVGFIPMPDNVVRDHRKIAFYDISEDDPRQGMCIFTGMGVGENYLGRNWEDRAYVMIGPAALEIKAAARQLLTLQGFEKDEIPHDFRARPLADNYYELAAQQLLTIEAYAGEGFGAMMQLHNSTGYSVKNINVAKAILYTLLPSGSVMFVPDSLWMNFLYGSMLAGSALRGCEVVIVAPTADTAPSAAGVTLTQIHELMSALIFFQQDMKSYMDAHEGVLKIGLYNPDHSVADLAAKFNQAKNTIRKELLDILPITSSSEAVIDSIQQYLDESKSPRQYLTEGGTEGKPKIHMKVNYFIDKDKLHDILQDPLFDDLLRTYVKYQIEQTGKIEDRESTDLGDEIFLRLGAINRKHFNNNYAFMTIGSANMDYRGMVLDGEVIAITTSTSTLVALIDMILLSGQCDWPQDQKQLDELMPPPSWLIRKVSNIIRLVL